MTPPLPPPPIQPFERLQVTDGLLINADRWRQAHHYHRQRQNIHYQSLNQPGIVCGLGIHLIPAPTHLNLPTKYRDGRWLQIQPGIAIDVMGNPIVVPEAMEFRISSQAPSDEPLLVYLVVSYVDPDELQNQTQTERVRETFRIDEKTNPPDDTEVELCRVLLQPGAIQLDRPKNLFAPAANQLDLRYRMQARSRAQGVVQIAQLLHDDPDPQRSTANLSFLLQSVESLYPTMQGHPAIGTVSLKDATIHDYDLLYLTGRQTLALSEAEFTALKQYLDAGGVLLVDAAAGSLGLAKSIVDLAQQLGTPINYLEKRDRHHPLRTQPFLFAALPTVREQPIKLLSGGGIVLIVGDLSSAWGLDPDLSLSRADIRTAQELGINILHFAWKRRSMMQLLGGVGQSATSTQPVAATPVSATAVAATPVPAIPVSARTISAESASAPPSNTPEPGKKSIFDELLG
jgi:hypothetical protein